MAMDTTCLSIEREDVRVMIEAPEYRRGVEVIVETKENKDKEVKILVRDTGAVVREMSFFMRMIEEGPLTRPDTNLDCIPYVPKPKNGNPLLIVPWMRDIVVRVDDQMFSGKYPSIEYDIMVYISVQDDHRGERVVVITAIDEDGQTITEEFIKMKGEVSEPKEKDEEE